MECVYFLFFSKYQNVIKTYMWTLMHKYSMYTATSFINILLPLKMWKKDMTNHRHVQWSIWNNETVKSETNKSEIRNSTDDECCNLANLNDQINALTLKWLLINTILEILSDSIISCDQVNGDTLFHVSASVRLFARPSLTFEFAFWRLGYIRFGVHMHSKCVKLLINTVPCIDDKLQGKAHTQWEFKK